MIRLLTHEREKLAKFILLSRSEQRRVLIMSQSASPELRAAYQLVLDSFYVE